MTGTFERALALHREGRFDEARALYEAILQEQPRHFDALNLLGTIALQRGDYTGAIALITQALEVQPRLPGAYNNRGVALKELGRLHEALRDYDKAIELDPANAQAHVNRGVALKLLGHPQAALASYDQALALAPTDPVAHNNRGVVLHGLKQLDAALAALDEAVRLQPAYADAWCTRGATLQEMGRLEDAVASYLHALQLRPAYAEAWSNLGAAQHDMGRFDEALASLQRATSIDANYADAWWNQSLIHLLLGRFEVGWQLYEWRRKATSTRAEYRDFAQPLWLGAPPLRGRTILLHAEQGLGDTIQFCRYAPLLVQQGARVVLEVPDVLVPVLRGMNGVQVIARGSALPAFDYQCPLMSLPLAFGTTLRTIPAAQRYLQPDAAKVQRWSARLGPRTKPRVGLVWSGRPTHRMDRERSIPLAQLAAVLPQGFEYISLQKELREEDGRALGNVRHFGDDIADFADTAALCELLDVVVSVDTAVAHLAGALGRPTWVMLAAVPDFRWMLGREDSPWYPGVRLFRQDATRTWGPVLEQVALRLAAMDAGSSPA
ncbi:tetratricopeptide repeat protein [Ramlibacter albus]|uniref:Glycosyltransferase family protein n=1 Tax=Ramlibacter albus TaxID=2079448 RepID=A0A923MFY1_9BURK|nr:tetratricopeptide repeat-containing glycosyltransferase family protein [Ramlibacter albus]MBC5768539.1 glycosyltransferase family protein [Ramlibacter albus]